MTGAGKDKRRLNWEHGGHRGRTSMAIAAMRTVAGSSTPTPEAKRMALSLLAGLEALYEELKVRGDVEHVDKPSVA